MIRVVFLRRFDRSMARLPAGERAQALQALERLLSHFNGGPRPIGLGLRKLRGAFWEIRLSLANRIVFLLERDVATFVLVGDHDEIRRLLRR
ncbi:MAG: hypothetical protein A2V88_09380 [Elusimicrobia bacterium RBG_16_66_12]|nr:MAG: hypothetical protein A2V88_09380 [Elusimicrobia bacterium RBG_16_66_12]